MPMTGWRRERGERELDAEVRDHIERHVADAVARGIRRARPGRKPACSSAASNR